MAEGPGTMTWEDFINDAKSMVKMSAELNDAWQLIGEEIDPICSRRVVADAVKELYRNDILMLQDSPGMAYISRQMKTYVSCDYEIDDDFDCPDELEEPKISKDPFEADSKHKRPLITLHNILWSMSYSVPVLYFNGWKSDFPGCNSVSVEVAQRLIRNDLLGYSELSQAMHPILATPFLQLHPCKSEELLRHFSKSKNKLVSWLSAAAPSALGLKLKDDYYKLTV